MTTARALLLLSAAGGGLRAQEWRSLESSRQLRSDAPAVVRVEYAAGTLNLNPTTDAVLYRMKLRYDAERSTPVAAYDAGARTMTIGTHSAVASGWRSTRGDGNTLQADLSNRVPFRLALELGATRADVQLGGLRLTDLDVRTGASELHVDVDAPNTESPAQFNLDVGAADATIRRAGNLHASRVRINIGAGSLDYDLAGSWTGDVELEANVAIGSLTLRVPSDVGVRVTARTFLADFDRTGLMKRGDAWYSPGYEGAARHADVRVTAVLGGFDLVRR